MKDKEQRGGDGVFCFCEQERQAEGERRSQFLRLVEAAKQDWRFSVEMLDEITEPDLIDYAVYLAKSNEAKYRHLIKIARKENWSAKI